MAAGLVADRPRRAGVVRSGRQRVVAAFAVGVADRMDRGEIDDVEPELGKFGELALYALEAAPRSREELVPRAELGQLSVDIDRQRSLEARRAVARLDPLDGSEQLGAERHVVLGRLRDGLVAQGGYGVLDQRSVGPRLGLACRSPEKLDALGELAGQVVLLRRHLAGELVAPGSEDVRPRLHRVLPAARAVELEAACPADAAEVGVDGDHLDLAPAARLRRLVADDRAEDLVAVAEDVGLDPDRVADDPLGGVPAVVDRGRRILDDDPLGGWPGRAGAALPDGVGWTRVLTRVGVWRRGETCSDAR